MATIAHDLAVEVTNRGYVASIEYYQDNAVCVIHSKTYITVLRDDDGEEVEDVQHRPINLRVTYLGLDSNGKHDVRWADLDGVTQFYTAIPGAESAVELADLVLGPEPVKDNAND